MLSDDELDELAKKLRAGNKRLRELALELERRTTRLRAIIAEIEKVLGNEKNS